MENERVGYIIVGDIIHKLENVTDLRFNINTLANANSTVSLNTMFGKYGVVISDSDLYTAIQHKFDNKTNMLNTVDNY